MKAGQQANIESIFRVPLDKFAANTLKISTLHEAQKNARRLGRQAKRQADKVRDQVREENKRMGSGGG